MLKKLESILNMNKNKEKVIVIAEAGVNHNGDLETAKKLIYEAKFAGANAIKFQSFITDNVISKNAKMANYQIINTNKKESQYNMVKRLELNFTEHEKLKRYADEIGITFLSSPFDLESYKMLERLKMPIYKIASGEITNFSLIKTIARSKKPIILSTGMSTLKEIEEAVKIIENEGNKSIILLQCTSNYPPKLKNVNLNAMQTIKDSFGYRVGYSDHTLGYEIALAAVALGAVVIEKHFTLDKNMDGPDHKISLEPDELKEMIRCIRNIEIAFGSKEKNVSSDEKDTQIAARKSIVISKDLKKGTILRDKDISIKRPGDGLHPKYKDEIIGRKINKDMKKDEKLYLEDLV